MPAPRRKRSDVLEYALRVAAGVMIVTTLWFGIGAYKTGNEKIAKEESSFAAPTHTLTADAQTSNAKAESKGPANWVRMTSASAPPKKKNSMAVAM